MDLAEGHSDALDFIEKKTGYFMFNLGTGRGISVLELKNSFENICSIKIPHKFEKRRLGDVSILYADTNKANKELGWVAKRNLEDICKSSWKHKLILTKQYNT